MLLLADIHGAWDALAETARRGEPLVILGDLLNFIDYRSLDGILSDIYGKAFVAEVVRLRASRQFERARARWHEVTAERGGDVRSLIAGRVRAEYAQAARALAGTVSYVTYGNVDWPEELQACLPPRSTFVDGGIVEIEGWKVGIVGGGAPTPLGVPGEITEDEMAAKLRAVGEVDILCTHAPPAVDPLRRDVVAGRLEAGFVSLREHILRHSPRWHYFGDIHQGQARTWRIGSTISVNVGYFRATRRPVGHR